MEPDIREKVLRDFGGEAGAALEIIEALALGDIAKPRILRAVVYLAAGDMETLSTTLARAATDYRDVLWQAEYDESGKKRLRDFTKTFPGQGLL